MNMKLCFAILATVFATSLAQDTSCFYDLFPNPGTTCRSRNKGDEVCNFYSDMTYPCFYTKELTIYCKFDRVPKNANWHTYISTVQVVFKKGIREAAYMANNVDPQMEGTFVNGQTLINYPFFTRWLQIIYRSSTAVVIRDYFTQSDIYIGLRNNGLFRRNDVYLFSNKFMYLRATGLFVQGCPVGYMGSRQRRDVKSNPACEGLPSLGDGDFLNADQVQNICNQEIDSNPNVVEELVELVKIFSDIQRSYREEFGDKLPTLDFQDENKE